MNQLLVDDELRSKLDDLSHGIELRDESGRVVGYFVPASSSEEADDARVSSMFSDEEIAAARNEPGGLTIEEVLSVQNGAWHQFVLVVF
jgi:hypothetical protein